MQRRVPLCPEGRRKPKQSGGIGCESGRVCWACGRRPATGRVRQHNRWRDGICTSEPTSPSPAWSLGLGASHAPSYSSSPRLTSPPSGRQDGNGFCVLRGPAGSSVPSRPGIRCGRRSQPRSVQGLFQRSSTCFARSIAWSLVGLSAGFLRRLCPGCQPPPLDRDPAPADGGPQPGRREGREFEGKLGRIHTRDKLPPFGPTLGFV